MGVQGARGGAVRRRRRQSRQALRRPDLGRRGRQQGGGEVKAKQDDPAGQAIPWLLLAAKSASGDGTFGRVSYIQRVATEAGKAPADGCTTADLGKQARVPYKALYRFYVAG